MESYVKVITCDSGDWEVLKLNNKIIAEGHSLSNIDWFTLLDFLRVLFEKDNISDEDMENGNY